MNGRDEVMASWKTFLGANPKAIIDSETAIESGQWRESNKRGLVNKRQLHPRLQQNRRRITDSADKYETRTRLRNGRLPARGGLGMKRKFAIAIDVNYHPRGLTNRIRNLVADDTSST